MAVGEAACVSVHGANRLGSNSLIDLVVFGRAAGLRCGRDAHPAPASPSPRRRGPIRHLDRFDRLRHASGSTPTAELRLDMQRAMQEDAAVFRTGDTLENGLKRLETIQARRRDLRVTDRGHDLEHRPGGDPGVRQPDRPGGGHGGRRRSTAPRAAAPTPARTSPTATTRTG